MSPRRSILRFCFVLIIVIALFGSGQRPVSSATDLIITVDSFEDGADTIDNDVCSAGVPVGGPCTLRAAISWANWRIPTQNIVIRLPAGEYNLTIPPDYLTSNNNLTGDLNINSFGVTNTNSITIEPLGGGQAIIKSAIEDRILSVDINAKVFINYLTMRGGHVFFDANNVNGGGAIWNRGNLYLNWVDLLANTVSCRNGTGCASAGGAIENWGKVTLQNATLDGNTAIQGGAIWNNGNLTITYSTLSNNHTNMSGIITNYANLTILNSTFSGNTSVSTLSGILNSGTLSMQSTTMANIGHISAIYNFAGPGITVNLQDNIFKAEPGQSNCYIQAGSTWTSYGYNIANDNSCNLTAQGDINQTDPMLGSFDLWGGSTKTIMLNKGSPAIDHRKTTCKTIQFPILDDQRHWPRDDGNCDTGAFEYRVMTDVGATKVWMPSNLLETLKVEVSFQLYRKNSTEPLPEAFGNPVAVTSGSGWKATWLSLPVIDMQGNPCTYFVREVNKPIDFITEDVDDLTVTNTYHPLLFLPLISK